MRAESRPAGRSPISDYFTRKIFVLERFLAVQVEEKGELVKEYGFDFSKGLYYEADPIVGYYKWFDLKQLARAFGQAGRSAPKAGPVGRKGLASRMARDMVEGRRDYPVSARRRWFGSKNILGYPARPYTLREGPGSSFINPFGWYRKATLWVSEEVPGFSDYSAVREELVKNASFYKMKHNRVSDLLVTLSALQAFPLEIDSTAKLRFMHSHPIETSRETVTFIGTKPVDPDRLLYFSQSRRFSWNVVFSEGTEFGPEPSREPGEPFSLWKSLPWLAIPGAFVLGLYLWFLGGGSEKDDLSLGKFILLRATVLSGLLLVWEAAHYLGEIPFIGTPFVELGLVTFTGLCGIAWGSHVHRHEVDRWMREARLTFCPHCHARCEEFYVECPNCNRPLR